MFELININKVYGDSKNSVKALKDISIKFPNKGLVAIIGTSGCGKSTLLNVMTTIDKPTSGKIYFCGKDVSKFNKKKLANYRGNEIGIVFQNFNLFEDETVYRNIIKPYLININKIPQIKNEIEKYCLYFGLNKEILNKNIYDLSGGEKQRVAIIRSLINNPKVIFADEPTGQLDESNSLNVLSIFKRISKDRLVIIVSHDLENVKKFTDKIIKMEDGKIINYPSFDISNGIKANAKYKRKSIFTWPLREGFSNLKRRKGKNVISSISIGIGLISTLLIQSFASNYLKPSLYY